MIEELPEIKTYEESPRAVKEMDPSVLLRKLKQAWSLYIYGFPTNIINTEVG